MDENKHDDLKAYTTAAYNFIYFLARKLHISNDEMLDILNDKRIVKQVVFVKDAGSVRHIHMRRLIQRSCIAAMAVLLILFLSVQGLADSVRESILRVFTDQKAVHVESITYDRYDTLQGYIVPRVMLVGYEAAYYTTASNNVLYMAYENGEGKRIEYYYYPQGASAAYDNERSEQHSIKTKFGTAYVWHSASGQTTAYLLIDDAYVQINFESDTTDGEIKRIIEGLSRIR